MDSIQNRVEESSESGVVSEAEEIINSRESLRERKITAIGILAKKEGDVEVYEYIKINLGTEATHLQPANSQRHI